MSQTPLKLGLVGAGAIAQSYAQALEGYPGAKLVAVVDMRLKAAQALAEGLGARAFESHTALAEKGGCDAVIICTPPVSHPEICNHFAEHGMHILCEKPLALDLGSAKSMLDTAQKHNVVLTMCSKFRYVEDVVRAKSIVASGILGDLILFENAFAARVDMTNRWNSNPAVSGGGVIIDNGTHSVDIMRYFLGPLSEVQATEGRRVQTIRVEDSAAIFAHSVDGVMGTIDLSWSLNKERDSYIDIYGSQGMVRIGWKESKYRQASSPEWVVFGQGYNKIQAFQSQIDNFCRALRGEEQLLIKPEDAFASVEVIGACYESLRHNDWIPVNGKHARKWSDGKTPEVAQGG